MQQAYKTSQRQRYFRLHDDSCSSSIDTGIPSIDNTKNNSMYHGPNPFNLKPSAEFNWYDEFSSRQVRDERVNTSFPFVSSSQDLEYRDAHSLQGGKCRSVPYEDTRDGTDQFYRQAFEDSSNHRDNPPKFDIGDVCCYLHGVDKQLISPPRLTRSSMADNSSHTTRRTTNDILQTYPLQTRHNRAKDINYEICRPIIPIYDHSYVGQPKFCIHRCRLPTQFLPILDKSKFPFIISHSPKCYQFPNKLSS